MNKEDKNQKNNIEQPGFFNKERMEKALKSKTYSLPNGLTRSEIRDHIELVAKMEAPINIDIDRMDEALSSPKHLMPSGLSRSQRQAEFERVAKASLNNKESE